MGIVSGLARSGGSLGRGYYIQTDAASNPGNSGGALVDMAGRLVGVNTSILSRSGGSQGVGFAIPANLVRQYVLQAEAGKTALDRPWLGAAVQTVDSGMAQAIGLPAPHGVAITQLHPQSPLLAAGLAVGDVVLAIDGAPIDSPQELDFRLTTLGVGATADIDFWRDGAGTQASLVLIAAPGGDGQQVPLTGAGVFDGLVVADLSPAMIDRLGLALDSTGVAVVDVTGQAQRMQLAPGDVIVSVNGTPIASVADLEDVARGRNRDWQIEFERGQQHLLMRLRRG
jgi:S1-C subfamily serine protease